jgi:apolipoprotein N-acyltransferase
MEVLKYHVKETGNLLELNQKNYDAILWPENSIDVDPFLNREAGILVEDLVKKYDKPLISGAVVQKSNGLSNSVLLWDPRDAKVIDSYEKNRLVPFGEYIPFRNLISNYVNRFDLIPQDFIPGTRSNNLRVNTL